MSNNQDLNANLRQRRFPTLVEWLIIVVIIVILMVLLVPQSQWASSGDIVIPVRILVFDIESVSPIAKAKVALFRGTPWLDDSFLDDFRERRPLEYVDGNLNPDLELTDDTGQAVVNFKFRTGASHNRPTSHAHTRWVWAIVQIDGYGATAVQLRQESLPTSQLRQEKKLRVAVGMRRDVK
jgi:hypothetical protein